jgi:hypothetical protein
MVVKLGWDAQCYSQRLPKGLLKEGSRAERDLKDSLRRRYPPLMDTGVAIRPCIIVDVHGVILAWYLPGILSNSRQVGLLFIGSQQHFKFVSG